MKYFLAALYLLIVSVSGCSSLPSNSHMSEVEIQSSISLATQELQKQALSEDERKAVRSIQPDYSYYLISGSSQADYRFDWKLPNGDILTIEGRGDLRTLSGYSFSRKHRD